MEVSVCKHLRPSPTPLPRQILRSHRRRDPPILVAARLKATWRLRLVAECANSGSAPAEEEVEEWIKAARLEEKCGGEGAGLVEMLECLEREAIMGDDQGREPHDYNRRAQIFQKSSRVFQALKERGVSDNSTSAYTCSSESS